MTATPIHQKHRDRQLRIDVGGLRSVESLVVRTGRSLKEYSDLYRRGASPEVVWDLRGCLPKRMNMATVTAFLSVADRLREFSGRPQKARVRYNPQIFQFWDDIDFISLVHDLDLFSWEPKDVLGGYQRGETNPDTRIFAFSLADDPPSRKNESAWINWKDGVRNLLREKMLLLCGPLFHENRGSRPFPKDLPNVIANTCAELVLNASMWGHSDSFVGLQRTSGRITAAVCDTGSGLLNSFANKPIDKKQKNPKLESDVESILLASLINRQDFGLRRAISSVVGRNGWVMMSSSAGVLKWRKPSWAKALEIYDSNPSQLPSAQTLFPQDSSSTPVSDDTDSGYCRLLECGLRGVRVSFEIPIFSTNRESIWH